MKSVWRWHFSDRSRREHEDSHFVLDAMNAIRLDDDVHLIKAARRHEEVVKENLHVVHAGFQLKVVLAPRAPVRDAVNHDRRRAEIKKKRKRKETGFYFKAGPWLLLCGHFSSELIKREPLLSLLRQQRIFQSRLNRIKSRPRQEQSDGAVD